MLHRHYYELYSREHEAMDFVDSMHNCEDILMNWVVAKDLRRRNVSRGVSVYLYPFFPAFPVDPARPPAQGISTKLGHFERRTDCVRQFIRIFGFVITERNLWSVGWHPQCDDKYVGCGRILLAGEPALLAGRCEYTSARTRDSY